MLLILSAWFAELDSAPDGPAFPSARGGHLHILRHTTAMHLLQAGVDCSVIALWLGHESLDTSHIYVEADLATKEAALNKLTPPKIAIRRSKPENALLAFLAGL